MLKAAIALSLLLASPLDEGRGRSVPPRGTPIEGSNLMVVRPDPRLEGVWRLVRVSGVPVPSEAGRYEGVFVLRFKDGELSAKTACNGFGGDYFTVGDDLHGDFIETTTGCVKPAPDGWDFMVKAAVMSMRFKLSPDGNALMFQEQAGRIFEFRRDNPGAH